jgi:ribosomal-protein-serine acetyltransferase
MEIAINHHIKLEQIEPKHAQQLFELASENRVYLRKWLSWVDFMQDEAFMHRFVEGVQKRHEAGNEWGFVILKNDEMIGRITVHKIDNQHKIGEIGYWIAEREQGQGIVNQCCIEMIKFSFGKLNLNRIEIKCGAGNQESQRIPERLNFSFEGILRQAELLNSVFIDLKLYALLKEDWLKTVQ